MHSVGRPKSTGSEIEIITQKVVNETATKFVDNLVVSTNLDLTPEQKEKVTEDIKFIVAKATEGPIVDQEKIANVTSQVAEIWQNATVSLIDYDALGALVQNITIQIGQIDPASAIDVERLTELANELTATLSNRILEVEGVQRI